MVDHDALNRLTIVATQRKLTDAELVEFLKLQVAISLHLGARTGLTGIERSMTALNGKVFQQTVTALQRLTDLDLALVEMQQRAKSSAAAATTDVGRSLWEIRDQALGDVLALLRAQR